MTINSKEAELVYKPATLEEAQKEFASLQRDELGHVVQKERREELFKLVQSFVGEGIPGV